MRLTKSKWARKPEVLNESETLSYQQLTKDNIIWLLCAHLHSPVTQTVHSQPKPELLRLISNQTLKICLASINDLVFFNKQAHKWLTECKASFLHQCLNYRSCLKLIISWDQLRNPGQRIMLLPAITAVTLLAGRLQWRAACRNTASTTSKTFPRKVSRGRGLTFIKHRIMEQLDNCRDRNRWRCASPSCSECKTVETELHKYKSHYESESSTCWCN